jgi:hypothetical protein
MCTELVADFAKLLEDFTDRVFHIRQGCVVLACCSLMQMSTMRAKAALNGGASMYAAAAEGS